MEISQEQWKEFQKFKEEYAENELTRNLLLQHQNDLLEGGLRSANLVEYRNTYVINAQDSLDADFPMLVHFNIISEMVKIISIKLSFWFLNFRAYSTGAKSGGGSVPTTSDGGGAIPTTSSKTTPSGGGSVPTSSYKTTPSGGTHTSGAGGSTTPTSSYVATPSGGGKTSQASSGTQYKVWNIAESQMVRVSNVGDENENGVLGTNLADVTITPNTHTHYVANHTHPSHAHTVTIPNHYHTVYNHTHPSHAHTVTIPNHTHPGHTHTVTIADHNHTVTIANHAHDIVYGIHEEENSPTIMPSISRDNGLTYSLPIGSYTKDQKLDITRFIDTKGSKMIKFTSTTRARLSVQIEIKLDIKAR